MKLLWYFKIIHYSLELLNKNLGGVSDEKFEELIKEENNFRDDLDRLMEEWRNLEMKDTYKNPLFHKEKYGI